MERTNRILGHLQTAAVGSTLHTNPTATPLQRFPEGAPGPYAYRDGKSIPNEDVRKTTVVRSLLGLGIFKGLPAVEVFDVDSFQRHCKAVQGAPFPPNTLHAVACKAQPTAKVLALAQVAGLGCETASLPELLHAVRCGFKASDIIFDSPSKSRSDIEDALKAGVWLNADNFMELEVINEVLATLPPSANRTIGIRVNVQTSKITGASITSTPTSKFGVGMMDDRQGVIDQYLKYPWLNAIHVHCGSQGVDVDFLVSGAKDVMTLVHDINAQRNGQGKGHQLVRNVDIGGGLETDYLGDSTIPRFTEYAQKLKASIPELWGGQFRLATEFGRALSAKSAFALSRVEYTKNTGGRHIATTHIGADYHVRAAYHPHLWMPKVSVYGPAGQHKDGSAGVRVTDIAGPLCFSGDLVVKGVSLPYVEKGDFVAVHDTGAYTMGMWSRYNSRQAPPCIGFCTVPANTPNHGTLEGLLSGLSRVVKDGFEYRLMKKGESVDNVLAFWQ